LSFWLHNARFATELGNTTNLETAILSHTSASAYFWTERRARFAEKNVITIHQTNQKS